MSRVTPLGRTLDALGTDLAIYTEYEHFSFELATPSLIPIHDLMHRYESRFSENLAFAGADEFFAKICNGARGVLVDSQVGKEQLIESYGPFSAEPFILPYIPPDYVYDESLLEPDPGVDDVLASLPEKFLFYPAQFWEHKNHIRLIDAVMQLAETYPDIHLALAGSPKNHYDAVISHIESTGAGGRVTLLGYVSDAAKLELYRRARALVMPSFYGPTNIPQLEAFELGCPVATSRIYGIPAQVGDAALLFDPESTDEIRESVEALWRDDALCADLVRRGHERASQWGPAQFSETLWHIVDECLQDG
jgi:glycosyltransferase involved in cell wall biosynthesis